MFNAHPTPTPPTLPLKFYYRKTNLGGAFQSVYSTILDLSIDTTWTTNYKYNPVMENIQNTNSLLQIYQTDFFTVLSPSLTVRFQNWILVPVLKQNHTIRIIVWAVMRVFCVSECSLIKYNIMSNNIAECEVSHVYETTGLDILYWMLPCSKSNYKI